MVHFQTNTKIALKERIKDGEVFVEQWKKEIEMLRRIEKEVPSLVTSRMICVMDDTSREIEEKYIVMEWVDGKDFSELSYMLEKIDEKGEKQNKKQNKIKINKNIIKITNKMNFLNYIYIF